MQNKIVNAEEKYIKEVADIESKEIIVPWTYNQYLGLLSQNNATFRIMLNDNNLVIGYYSFYTVLDEIDINNIAIRKDLQSQGLGSILFQDLLDIASKQNIQNITLEVETGNEKAIGLYKKFGFKIEGTRKNFYNNSLDAYIMWKR